MPRRLFIRFITRKWPPAIGGMETYSKRLCDELGTSADLDIIALPGRAGGLAPNGWQLIGFGIATLLRLFFVRRTDITHIGDVAIWPLGLAARLRHPSAGIVVSAHGSDLSFAARPGWKSQLYKAYVRVGASLLKSAVLIANSEATAVLARQYGFRRVCVVPLGTDMRPTLQTENNGRVLLAGRITPQKGLSWFVEHVLSQIPELKLDVAGTIWDAREADALNRERVNYLGALGPEALRITYSQALCVVVPSRSFEGFGLIACEAAAAGAVVVASAHSGLMDAVVDGQTGFLVSATDAGGWVERLRGIGAWSAAERARFIEASTKYCARRFSWARVAEETLAAYRTIRH